ncbi:MAG: S-adenosylmethionine:tRNA ribosyltransferase-isomerase [Prevotella sp.]|nr:S-adenosylmethionine:tRNA ribosyltransferase-isomerase [Prevotella sp.]
MSKEDIRIADYDYPLPDERIAKFPLAERDSSKLLIYRHGQVSHDVFYHLPQLLPQGALMVFNNTKVIQARLHFRKASGALIEVFLLEPAAPADYEQMFQQTGSCAWYCLVGNLKKWKEGELERTFTVNDRSYVIRATRGPLHGTSHRVSLAWTQTGASAADQPLSFAEVLDAMGELPIPPYLNRETQQSDLTTYQTVYSKIKGSVAAPTAGLHFTPRVLQAIDAAGIERQELTLHVGAGTFRPVKSEHISGHEMHTEFISVRRDTILRLIAHGGHAIAVGTTSVRTLESLYYMGLKVMRQPAISENDLHVTQWEPYQDEAAGQAPLREPSAEEALQALADWMQREGREVLHSSTQIIIVPGYHYHVVQMLVTNFHQPKSTLLLLVSAFVGGDWRSIYDYALSHDFRFLSYGDSSLLIP